MLEIDSKDKIYSSASFVCILLGLLLLKLSNFSTSVLVNLQNYTVKTTILQTSGMSTIGAVYYFLSPFFPVLFGLLFFAAALALLARRGFDGGNAGILVGILAFVSTALVFMSIWGILFGAGLFVACFYASKISGVYLKEMKKWPEMRAGARSVSRALFFANLLIALGIFLSVLSAQAAYEASFRAELTDSMKSIARSLPGASALPDSTLTQAVDTAIASSQLFTAYIRWLPVTTALSALFILEMLRNIILSNFAGLLSYALSKLDF